MIRSTIEAEAHAVGLVIGHVDASHDGTLDSECERCVTLAAKAGVDIAPRSTHEHYDMPVRIGFTRVWECATCGRIDASDPLDLRTVTS